MKYVIQLTEQGFPFYIKSINDQELSISIENDPLLAKVFDSEAEATKYMKQLGTVMRRKCKVVIQTPGND